MIIHCIFKHANLNFHDKYIACDKILLSSVKCALGNYVRLDTSYLINALLEVTSVLLFPFLHKFLMSSDFESGSSYYRVLRGRFSHQIFCGRVRTCLCKYGNAIFAKVTSRVISEFMTIR